MKERRAKASADPCGLQVWSIAAQCLLLLSRVHLARACSTCWGFPTAAQGQQFAPGPAHPPKHHTPESDVLTGRSSDALKSTCPKGTEEYRRECQGGRGQRSRGLRESA